MVSVEGIPVGPTWQRAYFLGADGNGRDVAMLRSSLAAPVSILGLDLSHAFGGYVLYVETIFRVPGVGALAESAVSGLDLPAVMADENPCGWPSRSSW